MTEPTPPTNPAADIEPPTIEWKGETYTLIPMAEWPVDAMEAVEDGKGATFVRSTLGPVQWRQVKSAGLLVPELDDLARRIAEAYGFDSQGE